MSVTCGMRCLITDNGELSLRQLSYNDTTTSISVMDRDDQDRNDSNNPEHGHK